MTFSKVVVERDSLTEARGFSDRRRIARWKALIAIDQGQAKPGEVSSVASQPQLTNFGASDGALQPARAEAGEPPRPTAANPRRKRKTRLERSIDRVLRKSEEAFAQWTAKIQQSKEKSRKIHTEEQISRAKAEERLRAQHSQQLAACQARLAAAEQTRHQKRRAVRRPPADLFSTLPASRLANHANISAVDGAERAGVGSAVESAEATDAAKESPAEKAAAPLGRHHPELQDLADGQFLTSFRPVEWKSSWASFFKSDD